MEREIVFLLILIGFRQGNRERERDTAGFCENKINGKI